MPKLATAISRPDLGAIAYEYLGEASQRGFVGLSLLPIFETPKQSAQYPVIPMEAILKTKDTTRAPRGAYNRDDYKFELGTYSCQDRGHEEPLDDIESESYRIYFDAEEVATKRAIDKVLRAQEIRIASKLFNATNLSHKDVSVPWNTAATATPQGDVNTAKKAMRDTMGILPNVVAMGWWAFVNLLNTSEIKTALRYTSPIEMGGFEAQKAAIAQYLGVSQVLVGGAVKDSAGKGKATVIADVWDDEYVLLAAVANSPRDLQEPCIGRTFLWTEDSPQNVVVESYREEQIRSNIYRVRHNVDECFVFSGAGYLLGNIIHP